MFKEVFGMNQLIILGNGFDLDHGLPTSYQDFRNYLLSNYSFSAQNFALYTIENQILPDGSEEYVLE